MEDLFSTSLAVNHQSVNYRVIFDQEKYVFLPEAGNDVQPSFSFKRENDQWVDQEQLPPEVKNQAVDALERYLLQQH